MWLTAFFLASAAVFVDAESACPHEDSNLKKISTLYDSFPKDLAIVIDEDVLLDVTELDVHSIDIIGEGRLVFNQGHDISIKTRGIYVKNFGHLIIGSETCRHENEVHIQLEGDRTVNRNLLGMHGEKYIAVSDHGTLQIHGEDRLAWTKLSGTVDRFNANKDNVHFRHLDTDNADLKMFQTGFAVHILDSDLKFVFYDVFVTISAARRTNKHLIKMAEKLSEAGDGSVIAISVQKEFIRSEDVDFETFFEIIETMAGMAEGELLLRVHEQYDAFSMVFVVGGDNYAQSLDRQVGKTYSEAMSSITYKNRVIASVSRLVPFRVLDSFIDLRVLNPGVGYPEVTVTHDISSWKAGDQVLLTSTDYAFNHGEVRTIKQITGKNSFILSNELQYRHFGEIESGVDMRGEVALLSRNIKISGVQKRGCPAENGYCDVVPRHTDAYGGHIKIMNFSSVVIQGAELFFMGQARDEGFYPIHFHMCEDITEKTAIIKRNSIHHTYRRAITIHGTFGTSVEKPGVQLYENVAFSVFGHTYFLEDGAEKATIFRGNLGAETRKISNDFDTDRGKPTTFWITNPKTLMVDNVAAGSEGFGIWYTFPIEPVGPSEGLAYELDEAKHTALWTFDNNVVHSNHLGGYNFDFIMKNEDGEVAACMNYETRENPFDDTSPGVKVQLDRLTAYKNREINVWLRGGWFELYQLSSAESKKGLQLARGSDQAMYVTKSIFLGLSTKNNEDQSYPDALLPSELGQVLGTVFHDGPTFFRKCWFDGFKYNESYITGAIGFAPKFKTDTSVTSSVADMRFGFVDGEGGIRVTDGLSDDSIQGVLSVDMQEASTFRDVDGSVTRCPSDSEWIGPVQVIKPEPNVITENCKLRENWNMAICDDLNGKLRMQATGFFPGTSRDDFNLYQGQVRRRRFDDDDDISAEHADVMLKHRFTTIFGENEFYYEFQYIEDFPKNLRTTGLSVEKGKSIVVGICLPEGVGKDDFSVFTTTPDDIVMSRNDLKYVDSLDEVASDIRMQKLYLKDRMLYVRISSKKVRDLNWDREDNDHCAGEFCPKITIVMNERFDYTPCFTVTDDQLNDKISLEEHSCTLPASLPDPDWGARDTLASEDGSWGQWSGWSECCNEAGGDIVQTTRYRLCDDPSPRASGADCKGESLQSKPCANGCPVDGEMTGLSDFSDCFCDGIAEGSSGVRSKVQECVNAANGGHYCKGDLIRYAACRKACGVSNENSVDGTLTSWSEWTDCFCGGIAEGSRGASTRSRTCEGTANYGMFCVGEFEEVRPCDADCYPDQ
ncbi:cell migration-inducing and hyaluronan-binding protein-like [Ruditapes philippinarum]|uniref:cell migration-inducing and hyaluronan-binding protein-like n=1 Tax=Ruditapes philippinarum TaxID=129788 RepID=UPI00295AC2CF|nr:cell migration-inducing and hyaluronan-binding protein-like [Ruditapes philippinarum]